MLTKVFQSGNSQAVRIPKELQLACSEVNIFRRGDELVIRPIESQSAAILFDILCSFEGSIERPDIHFQERPNILDETGLGE
ncbi:MAG: AbrB/MazE/SpoVT family DNA-binding domain-containing protein [Deinococcales bacterium]